MDYPLSKTDIERAFNGKVKVILYSDVKKYKNIYDLLAPYGRVVILYYWKKYSGHWICVFVNKNRNVEIFDSFGTFIDDTLKNINADFRKETNQDYKYLTKLLYDAGYHVEYNDMQLQDHSASTCGRWCVYRMKRNDLTIEQFQELFKKVKNKDKKIISYTNYI